MSMICVIIELQNAIKIKTKFEWSEKFLLQKKWDLGVVVVG